MSTVDNSAVQPELTGFRVALSNFDGPFDLLLQLIHQHKMDVTDVALAMVTDEFITYTQSLEGLEEVTEFLVVAATLLDLKIARLLPRGEVDDEEDLALLDQRDILFARLLQYQAYKGVADIFAVMQKGAQRSFPSALQLEDEYAELLPPVELDMTPMEFAEIAATVFKPRDTSVQTSHVHMVSVSVPEQAGIVLDKLMTAGKEIPLSFAELVKDCDQNIKKVGRFLAILELYKAKAVDVGQEIPLEELLVAWNGLNIDPAVVAASDWE